MTRIRKDENRWGPLGIFSTDDPVRDLRVAEAEADGFDYSMDDDFDDPMDNDENLAKAEAEMEAVLEDKSLFEDHYPE